MSIASERHETNSPPDLLKLKEVFVDTKGTLHKFENADTLNDELDTQLRRAKLARRYLSSGENKNWVAIPEDWVKTVGEAETFLLRVEVKVTFSFDMIPRLITAISGNLADDYPYWKNFKLMN